MRHGRHAHWQPGSEIPSALVVGFRIASFCGCTLSACEVWMSIVSTGVRIDADAQLEAAIVLPGVHIGSGAKIRNAIVAEKAVVSPHARIGYDADADWSQFPVSENGIVIVGASRPDRPHVPRESIQAMKARQSMALVSRRQK